MFNSYFGISRGYTIIYPIRIPWNPMKPPWWFSVAMLVITGGYGSCRSRAWRDAIWVAVRTGNSFFRLGVAAPTHTAWCYVLWQGLTMVYDWYKWYNMILILMTGTNVGKYTTHGASGYCLVLCFYPSEQIWVHQLGWWRCQYMKRNVPYHQQE